MKNIKDKKTEADLDNLILSLTTFTVYSNTATDNTTTHSELI